MNMFHQTAKKKPMNPEERLQARVGVEINRRLLREHAKAQADAVAVARWESTMGQRDAIAQKKRDDQKLREDLRLADVKVTQSREQKLKQLYADDAERYKAELHKRGLTFRSA